MPGEAWPWKYTWSPARPVVLAPEEVVEADLVEGGRAGVGGEMAADGLRPDVGPHHHHRGVPADEGPDPPFEVLVAGELRLLVGGDGVDVGGRDGGREVDLLLAGPARGSASAGTGPGSVRGRRPRRRRRPATPRSRSGSCREADGSHRRTACTHAPTAPVRQGERQRPPGGQVPVRGTVGRSAACCRRCTHRARPRTPTAVDRRLHRRLLPGNPGPGGWAWAVDGGPSDSGGEPHTTNQRMEVTAVIRALQALPGRSTW